MKPRARPGGAGGVRRSPRRPARPRPLGGLEVRHRVGTAVEQQRDLGRRQPVRGFAGKVVIGIVALAASLAMTAVYHSGYSDFRSDKVTKPLTGDVLWSVPTLATLNPIEAPIAHAGMHVSAVLHSYETDTFLPPHR